MSATQYSNEGRIAIFANDKGGNDKRPDYRGTFQLDGKEYRVSLWLRKSQKDGSTFMSGSIEPAQAKPATAAPVPVRAAPKQTEMPVTAHKADEDVPF